MAEAFLTQLGGDRFSVESAGIEPGTLNPLAVEAMQEVGIDISKNRTKDVFTFVKERKHFTHVITVCDETAAERCPIFPGVVSRLHWSFPDPSALTGTREEQLAETRNIRDQIQRRVEEFVKTVELL
jgi:arsenate reductase (thioredoxin)